MTDGYCPHGMCVHRVECEVEGCCVDEVCDHCGEYTTGCYCCEECGERKVRFAGRVGLYYCPRCEDAP
jgi:hypothetical protein